MTSCSHPTTGYLNRFCWRRTLLLTQHGRSSSFKQTMVRVLKRTLNSIRAVSQTALETASPTNLARVVSDWICNVLKLKIPSSYFFPTTNISFTFHANNGVQHSARLPGEIVGKCAPLSLSALSFDSQLLSMPMIVVYWLQF